MIAAGDNLDYGSQEFNQFIEYFAEYLLPKNSIELAALEALSRDLNMKIFISKGSSVVETWGYEFVNPVPVSVRVNLENPSEVDFILLRAEEVDCSIDPNLGQNLSLFSGLIKAYGSLIQEYPLSSQTKSWAENVLKKEPEAGKKWDILNQITKTRNKILISKELKTSNYNMSKLNLFSGSHTNEPLFLKKFTESIKPDYGKMFKDILSKKIKVSMPGENKGEEENKNPNPPKTNPKPVNQPKALPSVPEKPKFHCATCQSNPLDDDLNKLACKCKLSFECLSSSMIDRKCVSCNGPISDAVFNEMSFLF